MLKIETVTRYRVGGNEYQTYEDAEQEYYRVKFINWYEAECMDKFGLANGEAIYNWLNINRARVLLLLGVDIDEE